MITWHWTDINITEYRTVWHDIKFQYRRLIETLQYGNYGTVAYFLSDGVCIREPLHGVFIGQCNKIILADEWPVTLHKFYSKETAESRVNLQLGKSLIIGLKPEIGNGLRINGLGYTFKESVTWFGQHHILTVRGWGV